MLGLVILLSLTVKTWAQMYEVVDLGTLGVNYRAAYGINNNGQVVGESSTGVNQTFTLAVTTNTFDGLIQFQLSGQPGSYTLQASPDLINWTNTAVLVNTNGSVQFIDPTSVNFKQRFYRAVAPF